MELHGKISIVGARHGLLNFDSSTNRSGVDLNCRLQRMKQMGCFVTTSENVIFKLVGDKDHPKFNEIRPFLKDTSNKTGLVSRM